MDATELNRKQEFQRTLMDIILTMNLPYTRVHGGANKSNRSLAEGLAQRGHRVRAIVPSLATPSNVTHEQVLQELAADGVEVKSEGGVAVFTLKGVEVHAVADPTRLRAYLMARVRQWRPDWTLVSSEDQSQNLLDAALRADSSRVVYLAHTPQMLPFGPVSLYPGNARTELIGRAAVIVTISNFVADYIKSHAGFDAFVNHPPHFGEAPFPSFGSFDKGYVTLMNASAIKGLPIFLGLAKAMPDVQFAALAGYGTTPDDLAALNELPNVTLLKNRKSLDDILGQTRVLLMPSLWVEGFGMAVVDAMLRGIPVLASNFGGLTEAKLGTDYLLPVHPITTFRETFDANMLPIPIVPAQDIEPWRAALRELLTTRELYDQQSETARDVSLKFVSGLSVAPLEELLQRLSTTPRAESEIRAQRQQLSVATNDEGIGAKIAGLTPEQKALLMARLQKKSKLRAAQGLEAPPIRPVSRAQRLPLSFAQQRLWFLDQLEPGSTFYNVPAAVRLNGRLNVPALERTLNEIVRRHEVLRTTFVAQGGQPAQVVHPPTAISLPVFDLSNLSGDELEAEMERLTKEEMQQAFDLSKGPLVRAKLLRLGEREHLALLTLHHIVTDGWSAGVLVREIGALYEAFMQGRPSPLAELKIQYADFAVWQRQWLRGAVMEQLLTYWRGQLGGALPVMELTTDRPRPAIQSFRGRRENLQLPTALADELKGLSKGRGCTLFMTTLAAFKTLLHRYTQQEDLLVGVAIANRNRREIEPLIGFFVNTLVMRTNLGGDPTFEELMERVRTVALGAYAHQDVPFEKLVEEFAPERNTNRSSLFQVAFGVSNAPASELQLPELTLTPVMLEEEKVRFDLTLWVEEREAGELKATWYYDSDLFDASTVRRMHRHYETLLRSIVAQPAAPLSALDILTEEEKQRQGMERQQREEANIKKLKGVRRKALGQSQAATSRT
jgi:glycosyltransferase involved in cell wall biosynthesis